MRLKELICKIFGHKWKQVGWCTPNSGYIGRECKRCGIGHGTYLY